MVIFHSAFFPCIMEAQFQVELPSLHTYMADFGLATTMRNTNHFSRATMTEQLTGQQITAKSDMYAFGGVLTKVFGEQPL